MRITAAVLALALCTCVNGSPSWVFLDRGGEMTVRGKTVTIEELAEHLAEDTWPTIVLRAEEGTHWRYVDPILRTCRKAGRKVLWEEDQRTAAPPSRPDGVILELKRGSRGERLRIRFGEEEMGDAEEDFEALTEQIEKAAPKAVQLKIDPLVPLRLVLRTVEAVRAAGSEPGIE